MNFNNYRDQLKRNVRQLPVPKRLSFAILICNRLIPDYQRFVISQKSGDVFVINQALDYCKRIEKGFDSDSNKVNNLINAVDNITPDTNDINDVSGSLALNAAWIITETLNYILDRKEHRIVDIGLFAYSSVFLKISEKYPDLNESDIENNKEIIEEITWQLEQSSNVT